MLTAPAKTSVACSKLASCLDCVIDQVAWDWSCRLDDGRQSHWAGGKELTLKDAQGFLGHGPVMSLRALTEAMVDIFRQVANDQGRHTIISSTLA